MLCTLRYTDQRLQDGRGRFTVTYQYCLTVNRQVFQMHVGGVPGKWDGFGT